MGAAVFGIAGGVGQDGAGPASGTVGAAFAFGASFLMTILPSRQAAGITIADAIRYE